MSETLGGSNFFDAKPAYALGLSVEEQAQLLDEALCEPVASPVRRTSGVHFADFRAVLAEVDEARQQIAPWATPEHLMPFGRQSGAVQRHTSSLSIKQIEEKHQVLAKRTALLDGLLETKLLPSIASQVIESGTLDVPPYCQQGEELPYEEARRTCMNACIRMMFAGITGAGLSEAAMYSAVRKKHGILAEDDVYFGLLQSRQLQDLHQRKLRVTELFGTDLSQISDLAKRYKEKLPESRVFSMVWLDSVNYEGSWHVGMLLDASERSVTYHDPSNINGQAHKELSKKEFIRSWSRAFNRAHIIVAA